MSEVLRMSRKTLTATVVAATIAWSIGLSSLVAPLTANAAASGSLVRASLPAVYYVGGDGKRYVFPNEKTYKTWYNDFSGVMTITDAELAAMPIGGNATYKPGVMMVKITTDPKVYAVDKNGVLRWVKTEAAAAGLYGADWNKKVNDVPDAFFTNYTVGADIAATSDFNASGATSAATSINQDKGLSMAGGTLTGLSVMLSPTAGGVLPKGAMGVNFLKFDVKNGTAAALTVDSLTVHRTGVGASTDFANVYVYDGANRLTTGRTVNSSSNDASFGGLGLSLAAGETRSLWISADVAAGAVAGNTDALQLTDLKSGANSGTGMPLTGPTFNIAGATAGTVTVTKSGASPLSNVKAGGMQQKIAEFQLLAGAAEDISFKQIALFRGGAVNKDNVTNIKLTQAGTTVATAAGFDSHDRATLVLSSPLLLAKGNTKTFEVWGDIAAGARTGATETILTYLDQNTDLLATGATYGYGVTVDTGTIGTYNGAAGCALGAGNCSSTRIEGGQLTMSFNGPAAKNIGINAKNVELYNFTLAAQSNLEMRNLRMQIVASVGDGAGAAGLWDGVAGSANFKNVKVVDTATGATVAGPMDACLVTTGNCTAVVADTTDNLTFTETINLSAGQSRTFKVLADVANQAALAAATVKINQLAFIANDIRNLDNSTYIALTDIVPNTGVAGNADTLIANTVTVGASSTPVAQSFIQGTQGAALGGFTLKAGDAGAIRVSSVTLQGQIDNVPGSGYANGMEGAGPNTVATVAQSVKLWNGATQLGSTKSPATSAGAGLGGTVTFDNLNLTIAAGQTLTLTVSGNLASGLASLSDNIRWEVTAAGSVSATDADGNAVVAGGVFPVDGNNQTIAAAGTVTVSVAPDDSESEAGLVLGGSSNTTLAKLKFTASNEELKMTKGRFEVTAAAGVSSLSLYDGATLVGGPVSPNGAGQADFTGINFVIPKDASKVLTVKGNLNSVGGNSGAATGSNVTVKLVDPDRAAAGDVGSYEIRGSSGGSSTLITTNTATGGDDTAATTGRTKVLRKTKPTISLVALPSSVLSTGNQVAMRFTVSADGAGDVAFDHIQVALSKTANPTLASSGTSSLRRVGDSANLAGTTALTGALGAAGAAAGTLDILLTNEETVAAGTSRTYDVRLAVGGSAGSGDSVSASLNGDGAAAGTESGLLTSAGAGLAEVAGTARNFVWSDVSSVTHGDLVVGSSTDWANGRYLKVLPSDTQTMSK